MHDVSYASVEAFLNALDAVARIAQGLFLSGAVVAGALCAVDWGVRTRRLNPFSRFARSTHRLIAPIIGPVERRVVKAGGNPVNAPWWALGAIIVTGILSLWVLDFVRSQAVGVAIAVDAGPRGTLRLAVRWMFAILVIALIVRVVSSWFRINPFGRIVRWSHALTEPIIRPIRSVLPTFGMIDLSPLVAYFALRLAEALMLKLL